MYVIYEAESLSILVCTSHDCLHYFPLQYQKLTVNTAHKINLIKHFSLHLSPDHLIFSSQQMCCFISIHFQPTRFRDFLEWRVIALYSPAAISLNPSRLKIATLIPRKFLKESQRWWIYEFLHPPTVYFQSQSNSTLCSVCSPLSWWKHF